MLPDQPLTTRLTNPLLYARRFEFETPLPVEECVNRLYKLHRPRQNLLQRVSMTADIQSFGSHPPEFDVRIKRRNRWWDYTTAHAEGTLMSDATTKRTRVIGEIKFGIFYLLGIIAVPLVMFLYLSADRRTTSDAKFLVFLFAIAITVYLGWTIIKDYNKLLQLLHELLTRTV